MRNVLIAGAGTSGLTLAHQLLASGQYTVTVATDRGPDEIRAGRVLSSQVLFEPAKAILRHAGLDHWSTLAPQIPGLEFHLVSPDGTPPLTWTGHLEAPASSVDQRTTFARWLTLITATDRGRVLTGPLTVDRIDQLVQDERYDLVVIASARSPLADLFDVDTRHTPHDRRPARNLAMVYLDGMALDTPNVVFVAVPGYGEAVVVPALTGHRTCRIVLIEAIPGSEWDRFSSAADPAAVLRHVQDILESWAPTLAERGRDAQLTDPGATLVGAVTPVVREPVAQLPCGQWAWAIGDTIAPRDPISATGANDAIQAAEHYSRALLAHEPGPITPDFLREVSGQFFRDVTAASLRWTATLLNPPEKMRAALAQAAHDARVADALVAVFPEPTRLAAMLTRHVPCSAAPTAIV